MEIGSKIKAIRSWCSFRACRTVWYQRCEGQAQLAMIMLASSYVGTNRLFCLLKVVATSTIPISRNTFLEFPFTSSSKSFYIDCIISCPGSGPSSKSSRWNTFKGLYLPYVSTAANCTWHDEGTFWSNTSYIEIVLFSVGYGSRPLKSLQDWRTWS